MSGGIKYLHYTSGLIGHSFIPTPTRPHQTEPSHQFQPGLIGHQSLYTNIKQALSDRDQHRRQPGLIGNSPISTPTRPHRVDCRASTPTPTSLHRAELPHRDQPGLIKQSPTLTPTRPYQAEPHTNVNQAPWQPGLIRKSFPTSYNQALSG